MTDCEACASTVNTDVEYKSHESTPTEKARSRNRADIPKEERERERGTAGGRERRVQQVDQHRWGCRG